MTGLVLVAVLITLTAACGSAYLAGQQVLRLSANDPQIQLAEDAARALDGGASPADVVAASSAFAGLAGQQRVDGGTSLAPFLIVYDSSGQAIASNIRFDIPVSPVPAGVMAAARGGPDVVTWQPRLGLRFAAVAVAWSGGTVLAARSLRLVEERESTLLCLVAVIWLAGLVIVGGLALVGRRRRT